LGLGIGGDGLRYANQKGKASVRIVDKKVKWCKNHFDRKGK